MGTVQGERVSNGIARGLDGRIGAQAFTGSFKPE